ncbi:hypothetical protein HY478_01615 [Candidatus Uhrbacteria bacterium]|nr:hypothetical protein [Candidatus Uhrbacteria bacterium]
MPVTLACTTHDPNGNLASLLERWLPEVLKRFKTMVVSSSPGLNRATHNLLSANGVEVHVLDQNDIGVNYRTAIREGSKHGDIFYVDLDRILHWASTYPDELDRARTELNGKEWVLFERSVRALATHQRPLVETEKLFTIVVNAMSGWGMHDYLSGAFFLGKPTAEILNHKLTRTGQDWWGEYYITLLQAGCTPHFIACEGLEWETPDRFEKEIAAMGLEAWRARFETPDEWALRTRWATDFIEGALTTWRRKDL